MIDWHDAVTIGIVVFLTGLGLGLFVACVLIGIGSREKDNFIKYIVACNHQLCEENRELWATIDGAGDEWKRR